MKKFSVILLVCFLLPITSCIKNSSVMYRFQVQPEKPKPGHEISIFYNQDSTNLAGETEIKCIAYVYNYDLMNTYDVPLTNSQGTWQGKFIPDQNAFGVIFYFKSDDKNDNNNKSGYVVNFYDSDDKKIPGSIAGYAVSINRWGAYYMDLDRNKEKALRLFEEEFSKNPDVKNDFLNPYFEVVSSVKPAEQKDIIRQNLQNLEQKDSHTEKELELLADWYEKINEKQLALKYSEELRSEFPQSEYIQSEIYQQFRNEKDLDKKISILKDFENQFKNSDYTSTMYDLIANGYRDLRDYATAYKFLKDSQDKMSTYRFYVVAKRMLDENVQKETAEKIALIGIDRSRKELKNPSDKKPEYYSESEWKKEREYYLALNLFVYGKLLYENHKNSECLPVIEEAVNLTDSKDEEMNELYSKALVENGKYSKAMEKISGFIRTGNSSASMKSLLREAYLNEKGSEDGFDNYVASFENAAKEKLIEDLKNKMIIEPAPDFSLKDLNGNEVSLDQFKGKIIILDFWATWCGPCLASFPGMRDAVEKYKNDDNVKFLFVNSWERVKEKKDNAKAFIDKNNYPFRVLLDDENKVIEKYKVSGIPTKFVIDKSGNIRFIDIGFDGTAETLVEHLSTMISLAIKG